MSTARSAPYKRLWLVAALLVMLTGAGCSSGFRQRQAATVDTNTGGAQSASTVAAEHTIGPHNLSKLVQVAQWGKGRRSDASRAAQAGRFALATPLGVYFYNASDLSQTGHIEADPRIDRIALSPSGSLLASTQLPVDGVILQSTEDGRLLHHLNDDAYRIDGLAFSPDAEYLAYVSTTRTTDGNGRTVITRAVKLWQTDGGKLISAIRPESDTAAVAAPMFSPDGRWLAALAADEEITFLLLWDLEQRTAVDAMLPEAGQPLAVTFSPEGEYAAVVVGEGQGRADSVALWHTEDWTAEQRLDLPSRIDPEEVVFSPDGLRLALSGAGDSPLHMWVRDTGDGADNTWVGREVAPAPDASSRVHALAFSPDGTMLAAATRESAHVWDAESGALLWSVNEETAPVDWLGFTPDGRGLLAALANGAMRVRATADGDILHTLETHLDLGVNDVELADGGNTVIAGSSDGYIRFWDVGSDTLDDVLALPGGSVDAVSLSLQGDRLAAAVGKSLGADEWDDHVQIWSWPARELVHVMEPQRAGEPVATCSVFRNDVAFSPDGSLVAAPSFDHYVHAWQTEDAELAQQLDGHELVVVDVAYAPDGRHVASASTDGTVRIWRAEGSRLVRTVPDHFAGATSVTYSPDGSLLATSDATGQIHIWNAGNGRKLHTLDGQKNNISNIEFSPDGALLAAGGNDGVIEFWETATWQPVHSLPGHRARVNAVHFSENGDLLVTAAGDGTIRLWALAAGR